MRVTRYTPWNGGEMDEHPTGKYVEYIDYLVLFETAQKLADTLDNMPAISQGHIKIKDEALREFLDHTLQP